VDELATITKKMEAIIDEDPDLCSWKYLDMHLSSERMDKLISILKEEQSIFKRDDVLEMEKMSQHSLVAEDTQPTKRLRPAQKAKTEARKVAVKLWKEDRQMTIQDLINKEEMIEVTRRPDGNLYTEKTVRNWINKLCPDRSPGRRPKKRLS
jgi:hypothetical protein